MSEIEPSYRRPSTSLAGVMIAGKYWLEREIGHGGMGVVMAATHVDLDQKIAIKVLHEHAAHDQDALARFVREARAAAKIRSEHVARVMDVGTFAEGRAYIVMEMLEGQDLAMLLAQRKTLPVMMAIEYVLEACAGLAAAHAAGVVHRDLKPANLFLARQSDRSTIVKVLDFGVSKILRARNNDETQPGITQTGQVFGSPLYMSPEQLRATADVDARTDIWSVGIVLFEVLAGHTPFRARTAADILAAIVRDPTPSIRAVRQDVPKALEAVIMRCLEKEPCDRYRDMGELASALLPFAPAGAEVMLSRIRGLLGHEVVAEQDGESTRAGALEEAKRTRWSRWPQSETSMGTVSDGPVARSFIGSQTIVRPNRSRLFVLTGVFLVLVLALVIVVELQGNSPPTLSVTSNVTAPSRRFVSAAPAQSTTNRPPINASAVHREKPAPSATAHRAPALPVP